jgi:hypothetical protein
MLCVNSCRREWTMPTRRIPEPPGRLPRPWGCRNPEHHPPMQRVFEPGLYEHTCPGCGYVTEFRVPEPPTCAYVPSRAV